MLSCLQVYKGRWHSTDVAIKIISVRSPEELPRVLREAEVMLQLDHANIVRAFHASVWSPSEQVSLQTRGTACLAAAMMWPCACHALSCHGASRLLCLLICASAASTSPSQHDHAGQQGTGTSEPLLSNRRAGA